MPILSRWGSILIRFLLVMVRLLMGIMWLGTGLTWLNYADASEELIDAIQTLLDLGATYSFYRPFLESVVLPHIDIFASLVTWGELLTGISLFLGGLTRLGAGGAIFLLFNYMSMGGSLLSGPAILIFGLHSVLLISGAGRWFGADLLLRKKWPGLQLT